MSDGFKILLGFLAGVIVVLLFGSVLGGGGMMGGMGSMMGGGLFGMLFALLFWVLVTALIIALGSLDPQSDPAPLDIDAPRRHFCSDNHDGEECDAGFTAPHKRTSSGKSRGHGVARLVVCRVG
jgi:hypothetical protein